MLEEILHAIVDLLPTASDEIRGLLHEKVGQLSAPAEEPEPGETTTPEAPKA